MTTASMSNPPYEDLHIYYLEGCLHPGYRFRSKAFIGNWEEDGYSFLFFAKPAEDEVGGLLKRNRQLKLLDTFQLSYEEWHGGEIAPMQVSDFMISPPWSRCEKAGGDHLHSILIDPGVVFGNGLHPTTRDCLDAIHMAFSSRVPETVLDIGTGTGILALAAARLGAALTLAVDINPLSVKTAQKNIHLNGMSEKMLPIQGSAQNFVDYPVDFMIANIHYDMMRKMVETDGFYKKKRFLLSGLLKSEANAIRHRLIENRADIAKIWDQNGVWFTFLGETH
ncbi:MAG: 50S ribosomal protein L11 methyltransferase [Desulfobacterales bacterium]